MKSIIFMLRGFVLILIIVSSSSAIKLAPKIYMFIFNKKVYVLWKYAGFIAC